MELPRIGFRWRHAEFAFRVRRGAGLSGRLHGWFGLLVVCDAATVRRQAGEHAKLLNIIIDKLNDRLDADERIEVAKLKERLGHKRREVLAGTIFGILVALVVCGVWDFWK